ncbi:MAG TPA: L,D-transpeptidase family protein [Pirellulales bacterium]|nr:L,D-transpeptidase family protein [Pirellulales bacterium]
MDSIKTLFLAGLMSAAAYGVYVTVTASPPAAPPKDAPKEWENPQIELPTEGAAGPQAAVEGAAPTVELDSAAGNPGAPPAPPVGSAAPPFAAADSAAAPPGYPDADPNVSAPADSQTSLFAGNSQAAPQDRYPPSDARTPGAEAAAADRYPSQYSSADRSQAAPRYPDGAKDPSAVRVGYDEQSQPPGGGAHAEFLAAWDAAMLSLEQNRLADAHLALSEWYANPSLSPEEDAQLMELLDRLAGTVIYSRQHLLERAHEVQPGETLDRIADMYEVPWQVLANINGVSDPQRIRPGELLKVVHGPFDAAVELDRFRLTLFLQGRYAGRFRIGIGKHQTTPEGEFAVLQKLTNPTYYGDQEVIDQNDPNNPLGEYALDLGDHILIHGTNDPQSIGRADSRGCIRLDNRDVKDVFEILSARTDRSGGSKVTIRR